MYTEIEAEYAVEMNSHRELWADGIVQQASINNNVRQMLLVSIFFAQLLILA